MINVGREAMMAIGCIQAQRCHNGKCPTGVATQNPWSVRGLLPELKARRLANYVLTLRKEILAFSRACGATHPAAVSLDQVDVLDDRFGAQSACELLDYEPDWGVPRRLWPDAEMLQEPGCGQVSGGAQRARLLKKVGSAGHSCELVYAAQL